MTDKASQQPSQTLTLSIDSRLEDTVLVAMAVRGVCAMTAMSQKELNRMELCVVEVVNNAIEHAYQGRSGHRIEVELIYSPEENLEIVVSDYGSAMPEEVRPENKKELVVPDPHNPDTLLASGRGLAIVEKLMDHIHYQSHEGRNSFHMFRAL
ncbi:ATP-binding protein [Parendozoicomonas haliclonae]|uniref:Serine-protein kinase RsbW n=1 Tax=Parendozoicomonas haliclonae TaxID=1960125 RepID=A0A1X7AKG4_9GAMM|nr:ATP-binding protein [Parendozoicomonas haliclonae]SMA47809.1 Serine-protein kinase RsbW [Parendozoicomonas haliclonae]